VDGDYGVIRIGQDGTNTDTYIAGIIHGNGSGLTNLNGTNLVGTLTNNTLGNAATASGGWPTQWPIAAVTNANWATNTAAGIAAAGGLTNANAFQPANVNLTNLAALNGAGLTNVPPSWYVKMDVTGLFFYSYSQEQYLPLQPSGAFGMFWSQSVNAGDYMFKISPDPFCASPFTNLVYNSVVYASNAPGAFICHFFLLGATNNPAGSFQIRDYSVTAFTGSTGTNFYNVSHVFKIPRGIMTNLQALTIDVVNTTPTNVFITYAELTNAP
jgi:hypothetical protein